MKNWLVTLALLLSISVLGLSYQEASAVPFQVTITKSVDKPIVVSGTMVTFTYKVENTGTATIICNSINDDKIGDVPINGPIVLSGGVGASFTKTKSDTIESTITNTATAFCEKDGGDPVNDLSNAVLVTVVNPAASLDKTASKTQGQVGSDPLQVTANIDVFYAFKVTNTGNVALTNCVVTDPNLPGLVSNIPSPLAPNAMFTVFSLVAEQYTDDFQNTGSLSCDVPTTMGDSIGPITDTADVDVVDPMITLDKTASKTQGQVGSDPLQVTANIDVFYAFKVTNSGDVPLTNCVVTDPNLPGLVSNIPSPLAPNAMFTVFSSVAEQYTDDFQNTGTVTCDDVAMVTPTDSDTADVDVVDPMLMIEKRVDNQLGPITVPDGIFVTYSFKVTNSGDVPLTNCVVTDPLSGLVIVNDIPSPLASNAMHTVFANVFEINAPGPYMNTAEVSCDPLAMITPMATSNTVVVNVLTEACVDIFKTALPILIDEGDPVIYTYDITNCGDVDLTQCNVFDDNGTPGDSNDDIDIDELMGGPFSLAAPGGTKTFQNTVDIFDNTKNTGTVFCLANEEMINDMDMAMVTVITVGGKILPIDASGLFLAGIQTNAVWILPTLAGLAGTGMYLKFRTKDD